MTRQELENNYLIVDGKKHSPRYDLKKIEVIQDGEIIFVDDFIITATAQEVYEKWQVQQNTTPQPTELDLLKEQVINLQAYEVEKVEKKYMEVTSA